MNWISITLAALIGYLLGSISFSRVITTLVNPEIDLDQTRTHQSGTGYEGSLSGIGAYTASMALGPKYGGLVALLDILKAFIPVLVLRILYPGQPQALVCSLGTVLGHNFPIYYRFQGGRGLSPMMGGLLVLDPIGLLVTNLFGLILGILVNQPAAGMLFWMPLLTVWGVFVRGDWYFVIYSLLLIVLFSIANIPEFRTQFEYSKQGQLDEYNEMIYEHSSMMRMFKKMSDTVRFWER